MPAIWLVLDFESYFLRERKPEAPYKLWVGKFSLQSGMLMGQGMSFGLWFTILTLWICGVCPRYLVAGAEERFSLISSAEGKRDQLGLKNEWPYFGIHVVDEQTGRGVPLVQLATVNAVQYVTDSNGWVAFCEPDLFGKEVFFFISSHGYEVPADGFGFKGFRLEVVPGTTSVVKIRRKNIAERLYRITGQGIYRDSIILGQPVPRWYRPLPGGVLGCDSVLAAVFQDKIFWFWGDTQRASYPLGNFWTTGATSALPGSGEVDPEVGIPFEYFVGEDGFVRPVAPISRAGPVWLNGPVVLGTASTERMFAHYVVIDSKSPSFKSVERGLAVFDPQKQIFEKVKEFPPESLFPDGAHPLMLDLGDGLFVYFCNPFPLLRVRAEEASLQDPSSYEAWTPLVPGSRRNEQRVDSLTDGKIRWDWKAQTEYVHPIELAEWVEKGIIPPEEARLVLYDVFTGKPVRAHRGSLAWNSFRKCFVMIFTEFGGTSLLGEVWYAEGDTLLGPWGYTQKVVTHDRYSFYNPKHHPFFDQQGGRFIYFEGTYTAAFSDAPTTTPYYDYNQIMYRLDLADESLRLPIPVYEICTEQGTRMWMTRWSEEGKFGGSGPPRIQPPGSVSFWAWDRPGPEFVPVFLVNEPNGVCRLTTKAASELLDSTSVPIFYVVRPGGELPLGELSAESPQEKSPTGKKRSDRSVFCCPRPRLLSEWQTPDGSYAYTLEDDPPPPGARKIADLGKVFPHPGKAAW